LADRLQNRRQRLRLVAPPRSAVRTILELTGFPAHAPVEARLDDAIRDSEGEAPGEP
jgi:hypothetical protein